MLNLDFSDLAHKIMVFEDYFSISMTGDVCKCTCMFEMPLV